MHVFKTVKGVTKTDMLCAIIKHNVHVVFNKKNMQGCFKLDESNSTRKRVLKSTVRFTLTLLALSIDPVKLYHILWVPNRLKEC